MVRDTDADWRDIAKKLPYWGVLSEEQYNAKKLDKDVIENFYATGEEFVNNLVATVQSRFGKAVHISKALDFGCGVGRLLLPLARMSEHATGIDIAPDMLRLCQKRADSVGIKNITLVPSDDTLSKLDDSYDFINSYIVFQHIPPSRGYVVLENLLWRLSPGGVAAIHLTYAKRRSLLKHEESRAQFYRRDGDHIVDLLPTEPYAKGTIQMFDYDLNQLFLLFHQRLGYEVMPISMADGDHIGCLFLLRRP